MKAKCCICERERPVQALVKAERAGMDLPGLVCRSRSGCRPVKERAEKCKHGHVKRPNRFGKLVCDTCNYAGVKRWRERHPEAARVTGRVGKRKSRAAQALALLEAGE